MSGVVTPAVILSTDAQARAQTSAAVALTPANLAGRASFRASLSANQTGIADATATKVSFDTEAFDVGAAYDAATNFRWTPPAGKVCVHVSALLLGTWLAGNLVYVSIYKNGALFAVGTPAQGVVTGSTYSSAMAIDNANGTDYYEAFVYIDTSASTGTVSNSASGSFFEGWQL